MVEVIITWLFLPLVVDRFFIIMTSIITAMIYSLLIRWLERRTMNNDK